MKIKIKATIEHEYEIDSKNYKNVNSISEMIKENNSRNDPYIFLDSLDDLGSTITDIRIIEIKE